MKKPERCPYCKARRETAAELAQHLRSDHFVAAIRDALDCPDDRDPIEYARELRAELERLQRREIARWHVAVFRKSVNEPLKLERRVKGE